ncbi:MAG: hypothetical protein J5793_02410 [Clostridia bacterium]|nr:hypothetical protein [Clostridia bacterium]
MGLFDNIKNKVNETANNLSGKGSTDVVFSKLPDTYEEFIALPQAALSTPQDAAALTVLALCFYPQDREVCYRMLDFLRGPRPMSPAEKQFIRDRFMDYDYVARSYFKGAVPANDYLPTEPYTITVSTNPYSFQEQGYAKMFIRSGGADTERSVQLRQAKDGKWYLWEQFLLVGIRAPESTNPWA